MAEPRTIIPIAGGKGGVGKTFVTANLAVALARLGHRVVAADMDLGNSNLHTFVGLQNRYAGIGEFLRGTAKGELSELIVQTREPKLGFLPGDARMPFMANITYNQKRYLLRSLKQIPARYILLDLSAGTSFTTLDLFLISDSGILVTTPEYPAILSMLVFLKNAVLRAIDHKLRGDPSLVETLNEMYTQSVTDSVFTVDTLRRKLAASRPDAAATIDDVCRTIRPRLVYNMMERSEDTGMFARIDQTLKDALSIECDHFGVVPYDPAIRQLLKSPDPSSWPAVSNQIGPPIERLAKRVVRFWEQPVVGSADLLTDHARTIFPDQIAESHSQDESTKRSGPAQTKLE